MWNDLLFLQELVKQIAESYLFLVRANKDEVVRVVGKDERYYSATTFSKACSFELAEKVSQHRAAFDEADIPSNYLCEIMADIMSDPVMFPQSRKVADRTSALRVIMGNDRDPFANTPVKVEDFVVLWDLWDVLSGIVPGGPDPSDGIEGGNPQICKGEGMEAICYARHQEDLEIKFGSSTLVDARPFLF
eukprot:s821_g3.t1